MARILGHCMSAMSATYFFALYLAFSLLAPCKPASAQDFEVASGSNSVAEPPISYTLLGQNFTFGRNVSASASMFRNNSATLKSVGSTVRESSQVTIFSKPTTLFTFTGAAFNDVSAGSKSWGLFLSVPTGQEVSATGSGNIKLSPKITGEQDVTISPTITLTHDFGTIKGFRIPVLSVDIELDVNVHVTTKAALVWNITFTADGEDVTKSLDTTSTAKITKDVKLLRVGLAIFNVELKLEGKASFEFSDTTLKLDEHPTVTALKGEVDSKITPMKLIFEGGIKLIASVNLPVAGEIKLGSLSLVNFDPLSFTAPKAEKVLFKR